MMDTRKLRQKILDLAIRGRLAPQDPADEPAALLLHRINPRAAIIEENHPFEVPDSWVWCKLGNIVEELKYGTSEKSLSQGKIAVLRMGNITNVGTIDYSNLVYSSNEEDIKQYSLENGDLLFNRTNSSEWVGKTAVYKGEIPAIYAGYLIRVRPIIVNSDYLNSAMNSTYYRDWCHDVKTDAVNQSNINAKKLSNLSIPLPPFSEQERIVKAVERWMKLADEIEAAKGDLAQTTARAKAKVLDLAIRGRLVPQDPTDEPAAQLLQRINPQAAPITHDTPFEIPDSWVWVAGSDLFAPMQKRTPKGTDFLYIDIDSIDNKKQKLYQPKQLPVNKAPSRAQRKVDSGDIVFAMVRPYLKNIALVDFDDCIASTGFYVFHPSVAIISKFAYYLACSDYVVDGLNSFMKGDNSPSINKDNVEQFLFPLPPLPEQSRIVAAIERHFAQLDTIAAAL